MKAYIAFTKKEFIENIRTYKLFIMGIVFLLFGMMNPFVAKYTPAIIEAAAPEFKIDIPEPSAIDSWTQFFSNIGQMGTLTLVIVFSGIMASEISKGTLINMLTKGLKRSVVIFSKYTIAISIWTLSYLLSLVITYLYTAYFFDMESMNNVFLAFFSMWLFGVLLINLVILGGILFKNTYGGLLFTGVIVVIMTIINISPRLHKYNPITLSSGNISLLTASAKESDFIPAVVISFILIVILTVLSVMIFNKKQL